MAKELENFVYYWNRMLISYIEEITPDIGGALFTRATYLNISNCIFSQNNGKLYGGIYIGKPKYLDIQQKVFFYNLILSYNRAAQSGGLGFSSDLENFYGLISSCYFSLNEAGCMKFYYLLIILS